MKTAINLVGAMVIFSVIGHLVSGQLTRITVTGSATGSGKTQSVGAMVNLGQRDRAIQRYKKSIDERTECQSFGERFERAGKRHKSAANGAFVLDMRAIYEDAEVAGCVAGVPAKDPKISQLLQKSIERWQLQIDDDVRCAPFKEKIREVAIELGSPARGSFSTVMQDVVDKAQAYDCRFVP